MINKTIARGNRKRQGASSRAALRERLAVLEKRWKREAKVGLLYAEGIALLDEMDRLRSLLGLPTSWDRFEADKAAPRRRILRERREGLR